MCLKESVVANAFVAPAGWFKVLLLRTSALFFVLDNAINLILLLNDVECIRINHPNNRANICPWHCQHPRASS